MHVTHGKKPSISLLRSSILFLSLLSIVVALAACGGSGSGSASASNTSNGSSTSTCNASTGLTLYSAQGYDSDMAKAFQKQTGITTKLVDDSTGNLLAKISAEGNVNPQWDVVWFDGNVTMKSLDDQNALLKWSSPSASNLTTLGQQYVASDNSYDPTGLTTVGAIAYNTKHIPTAGLPKDWSDLLKPAYKNLVAMNDPALSGPTYPLLAGLGQILGGENQGKQYFSQLKANGLQIFQTNNPTLNSVETGAREFAIVQDSAIYSAIKAGQPINILYPASGVVGLPSVIGIAAQARHQACAKQFVNWVLSPAGQSVMTHHDPTDGDTYFVPLVKGVTPVVTRRLTGINYVNLNLSQWSSVEAEYKQWFHTNIVQ